MIKNEFYELITEISDNVLYSANMDEKNFLNYFKKLNEFILTSSGCFKNFEEDQKKMIQFLYKELIKRGCTEGIKNYSDNDISNLKNFIRIVVSFIDNSLNIQNNLNYKSILYNLVSNLTNYHLLRVGILYQNNMVVYSDHFLYILLINAIESELSYIYFYLEKLLKDFDFEKTKEKYRANQIPQLNIGYNPSLKDRNFLSELKEKTEEKNKIQQKHYEFYFYNDNLYIYIKLKNKKYGQEFIKTLFKDLELIKYEDDFYKVEGIQLEENTTLFGENKIQKLTKIGIALTKEFVFEKFREVDFKRTSKGWLFLGTDSLYKKIKIIDQTLFFNKYDQVLKLDNSKIFRYGSDLISFDDMFEKQEIEKIYGEIYDYE